MPIYIESLYMQANKTVKKLLLLIFFTGYFTQAQAVYPHTPRETAIYGFLIGSIVMPLEIAFLEKISGGEQFSKTIKNPKLWMGCALASLAYSGLSYYILQKYTPEYTYNWALDIQRRIENYNQLNYLHMTKAELTNIIQQGSKHHLMNVVHYLWLDFHLLEQSSACLTKAPEDLPDDVNFAKNCEELNVKIKELQQAIKQCVLRIVHTKQWVAAVLSKSFLLETRIPETLVKSFIWSAELKGIKFVKGRTFLSDYFSKDIVIDNFLGPDINHSTVDWDDYFTNNKD